MTIATPSNALPMNDATAAPASEYAPVTVSIHLGSEPMYVVGLDGVVLAPESAQDRAAMALALAQAAASLAMLPPIPTPAETALSVVRSLGELGTPEAISAIEALGDAAETQTAALEGATAVLQAALPTAH